MPCHAMETYGGSCSTAPTLALDGHEWSASQPGYSVPGKVHPISMGQEAGWAPKSV
jgi:hypothetical protein